jgi:2-polyprenyl-6-methoxyphenol hydroxylase-like FAD-dependent oxidoreductase
MGFSHPPVLIIGAGIGGLSLALPLRQRGVTADVLEQSGELREAALRRYPAALHLPDGPAARDRDGLLPQLPQRLAWIHGHDALA